MKNLLLTTIFILIYSVGFSQTTERPLSEILCDKLRKKEEVPIAYNRAYITNAPLPPAPCNAKDDYNTFPNQVPMNLPGYWIVYEQVETVTKTVENGKTCTVTETVLEKQITEIGREYVNPNKPRPSVYVIRMELMTTVPDSRPLGTKAYRLASGQYQNYIVTGWGEFSDWNSANIACEQFKEKYPEFCQAYPFYMPGDGYSELYEYLTSSHSYE